MSHFIGPIYAPGPQGVPAETFTKVVRGVRSEPGLPGSDDDDRESALAVLDPLTGGPLPVRMVEPRQLTPAGWHPAPARDERYLAGLEVMRTKGVRLPIAVRSWDGVVVDGHRRLATALELGLAEVPVVVLGVWRLWVAFRRGSRLEIGKAISMTRVTS